MDAPSSGPDQTSGSAKQKTRLSVLAGRLAKRLEPWAFELVLGACLFLTVLPLWAVRYLPCVDVPQHVFLVQVLAHLGDTDMPYGEIFVAKPGLTYLAFYYPTRLLSAVLGAETAVRVWLTLMLAAMPISISVLLRSLGRPPWPALLACPLVFTDNFYWGFISFQSSIPFTLLSAAFFIRTLDEPSTTPRYRWYLAASAASLILVQLTHGAAMIFPAIALPLMLLLTPSDWPRRIRGVLALVPGVALFLAWVFGNVDSSREHGALGEPWKVHGSLFQRENFVFHPVDTKPRWFLELLSNGFRGEEFERNVLYGLAAVSGLALLLWVVKRSRNFQPWYARLRPWVLCALGVCLFLYLPSEIRGYMSPIDSRYAQVAALLAVLVVPSPTGLRRHAFVVAAAAVVAYAGANLVDRFRAFDREATSFDTIVKDVPSHARLMHLVQDWSSSVATHPVYLHFAALAAARIGGTPSFSLATDAAFPVGYQKGRKPPASPWEWRPTEFDWRRDATWYDYYLTRGQFSASRLFPGHESDVQQVRSIDGWTLLRRVR